MTLPDFPLASIGLENVTLSRGGKTLVRALNLSAGPGEAIFLTGRNGAGKTTLLRVIAGLFAPDSGAVSVTPEPAQSMAWLGHADGLKPGETPREAVKFHIALTGGDAALERLALEAMAMRALADRPAQRLSRGQKRRSALARVIASNRPIWLLDEPAGPLDLDGRDCLAKAVADHRSRGGLVIAATHQILDWPDAQTLDIHA